MSFPILNVEKVESEALAVTDLKRKMKSMETEEKEVALASVPVSGYTAFALYSYDVDFH